MNNPLVRWLVFAVQLGGYSITVTWPFGSDRLAWLLWLPIRSRTGFDVNLRPKRKQLLIHMPKGHHDLAWCKYTVSFGSSLLFFPKHLESAAVPMKPSGVLPSRWPLRTRTP